MQTVAVIALVVGLVMLFRWLGPPTRRMPEDRKASGHNPEEDIPPPTDYSIS